jgi:hypothetical protein
LFHERWSEIDYLGLGMSRTLRALPTLLKVGFAEAVAYRAEFVVWLLSTNMTLVMLALWTGSSGGSGSASSSRITSRRWSSGCSPARGWSGS